MHEGLWMIAGALQLLGFVMLLAATLQVAFSYLGGVGGSLVVGAVLVVGGLALAIWINRQRKS